MILAVTIANQNFFAECTDAPNPAMTDLDAMEHPMLRGVGSAVFRLVRRTAIGVVHDFCSDLWMIADW